jgi:hypothetical protein
VYFYDKRLTDWPGCGAEKKEKEKESKMRDVHDPGAFEVLADLRPEGTIKMIIFRLRVALQVQYVCCAAPTAFCALPVRVL